MDVRVSWLRADDLAVVREHARQVDAKIRARGAVDRHGYTGTPEQSLENLEAAATAELAVSRYTRLPWNTDDRSQLSRTVADVGVDLEVKNRLRRYREYLIVHPDDLVVDHRYVITYGRLPDLWLAGWLHGHEAAELPNKPLGDRVGGHVAQAEALHDIRTLEPLRGRELVCNSCLEILEVFEAPEGWIDPELYRCGRCIDAPPVDAQRTLALEPVKRAETPKYDPAQSRIPF